MKTEFEKLQEEHDLMGEWLSEIEALDKAIDLFTNEVGRPYLGIHPNPFTLGFVSKEDFVVDISQNTKGIIASTLEVYKSELIHLGFNYWKEEKLKHELQESEETTPLV